MEYLNNCSEKKSKTKTRDYAYILQHRYISEVLGVFKEDEHERGHSHSIYFKTNKIDYNRCQNSCLD